MKLLIAFLFGVVAVPSCFAQKHSQTASTASLSKPVDIGSFSARMFPDAGKVVFKLKTSWIPGSNQKGMLRYMLTALPEQPESPDVPPALPGTSAALLGRVLGCSVFLGLYDADGFRLRQIEVHFDKIVDDDARLQSLLTNEAVQMDAQEYRNFASTGSRSKGSWDISWALCRVP